MTWWRYLTALPPDRSGSPYLRLRRVWFDHTRGSFKNNEVKHEWLNADHETRFTLPLWENFAVLPVEKWLPDLLSRAGLPPLTAAPTDVNWSYEYEWAGLQNGRRTMRQCDVVVEYRTAAGEIGGLVVEAKKPGRPLTEKDLDPEYYLNIPTFGESPRLDLLYLVDTEVNDVESKLLTANRAVGVLDWSELGAVQIAAAPFIGASEVLQAFVAGSIASQYGEKGVTLAGAPLDHLQDEPRMIDVVRKMAGNPQTTAVRQEPLWRLPSS